MDLSTMKSKLNTYTSFSDFESDINLICSNCNTYNGKGTYYSKYASSFMKKWKSKRESIMKLSKTFVNPSPNGTLIIMLYNYINITSCA